RCRSASIRRPTDPGENVLALRSLLDSLPRGCVTNFLAITRFIEIIYRYSLRDTDTHPENALGSTFLVEHFGITARRDRRPDRGHSSSRGSSFPGCRYSAHPCGRCGPAAAAARGPRPAAKSPRPA